MKPNSLIELLTGTMDAMMTSKGDVWVVQYSQQERLLLSMVQNPPEENIANCNKEVDEVLRVLQPNGVFLYITFGRKSLAQQQCYVLSRLQNRTSVDGI